MTNRPMTPKTFQAWLDDMKARGDLRSDAEAARALGIHANTLTSLKEKGASQAIALACTALMLRLKGWTPDMPKCLIDEK